MPGWLPAVIAVVLSALAVSAHIGRVEAHLVEHFDRQVKHLRGVIAMSSQDAVNAVVAQIRKGTAEVVGRIADLQAQVDAGQPVDLTELAAAAQALDDIVADAPVDPVPTES